MINTKIAIIILVAVAVVLGVFIFKPNLPKNISQSPTVSPSGLATSQIDRNLTGDEKKLLTQVPTKSSSQEELMAHYNLAVKLAVISSQLEIGNCETKPLVLKVKDGSSFTIKNSSDKDRAISFDADNTIYVPAGKTHVQQVKFKNGPGLYGYGCDFPDIRQTGGFVLVEPKQ